MLTVDSDCMKIFDCFLDSHMQLLFGRLSATPKRSDLDSINRWIKLVTLCFTDESCVKAIHTPVTIIDAFSRADSSFVLTKYRFMILGCQEDTESLKTACIAFSGKNSSFFIRNGKSLDAEMHLFFDWMCFLLGKEEFTMPTDTCPFSLKQIHKLKEAFMFDVSVVIHSKDWIPGTDLFRTLYRFLTTCCSSPSWNTLHWWPEMEGFLICSLYEVAGLHEFFLPRLLVSIDGDIDNVDIVEREFDLICGLASFSNHKGHAHVGIEWCHSICLFVSDKNVLDTDVGDSAVLSLVETCIFKYLDLTRVDRDPTLRSQVANLCIIYLKNFSRNRRGRGNSAELMKRFVERWV